MTPLQLCQFRHLFLQPLEQLRSHTCQVLQGIMGAPTPRLDLLADAIHNFRTVSEMGSALSSQGLQRWGGDLESLFNRSKTMNGEHWRHCQEVSSYILSHDTDWQQMNQLTSEHKTEDALNHYEGLRPSIEDTCRKLSPSHVTATEPTRPFLLSVPTPTLKRTKRKSSRSTPRPASASANANSIPCAALPHLPTPQLQRKK